jgi:hypothetical protein
MCTLDQKCIPLADGLYNVTGGENKAWIETCVWYQIIVPLSLTKN